MHVGTPPRGDAITTRISPNMHQGYAHCLVTPFPPMGEFFGSWGVSGGPRADQTGVQFTPTWPAHELTTQDV